MITPDRSKMETSDLAIAITSFSIEEDEYYFNCSTLKNRYGPSYDFYISIPRIKNISESMLYLMGCTDNSQPKYLQLIKNKILEENPNYKNLYILSYLKEDFTWK